MFRRPLALFDLQIERHDGERLALSEAVEHCGAAKGGAHLFGHRVDEGRALLLGADARGVVVFAAAEELLEEGSRGGVDDAAHLLVGGNLREFFRYLDGAVESAELVNEAVLATLRARPDSPLRDLVNGPDCVQMLPLGDLLPG